MDIRDKANKIINEYTKKLIGTQFLFGQFGGQFGLDSAPLTAMLISMVTELCKLYGIEDDDLIKTHRNLAIKSFNYSGTILSRMLLNWIPLAGPTANSAVIFQVTKNIGIECVNNLEKNRPKLNSQSDTSKTIKE